MKDESAKYLEITEKWITQFVVKYNICPFAASVMIQNKLHLSVHESNDFQSTLKAFWELMLKLEELRNTNKEETAILLIPGLVDFDEYLDVFYAAEQMLYESDYFEKFQLASFHPDYQFEGSERSAISNYTNRSPYAMIHILAVDDVTKAVDAHPNVNRIPEDNIQKLEEMGETELSSILKEITKG